jgi:sulfite exporter TauE/SafE
LMVMLHGASWIAILLWSNEFWVKHSVGMCSPLNKLFIESKITYFGHQI